MFGSSVEVFIDRAPDAFPVVGMKQALPETDVGRGVAAAVAQQLDPPVAVENLAGLDVPIPGSVTHGIQCKPKTGFGVFD